MQSCFCHLEFFRPNIFALSETQVFNEVDIHLFKCPDYNFIYFFFHHRGIGIYLRSSLSFTRHTNYESSVSALLSLICWSVLPRSLRGGRLFRVPYHRTNYGSFEPMNNMLTIMNEVHEIFDYHVNRDSFRSGMRILISSSS